MLYSVCLGIKSGVFHVHHEETLYFTASSHDNARRVLVLFPKNLNAPLNLICSLLFVRLLAEVESHVLFQFFVDIFYCLNVSPCLQNVRPGMRDSK